MHKFVFLIKYGDLSQEYKGFVYRCPKQREAGRGDKEYTQTKKKKKNHNNEK